MDQQYLIDQLTTTLKRHPQIGAAFLGGSHGRDEADPFSDVDVYAVVSDTESIQDSFKSLADPATKIAPILYLRILPNARTINCITEDWMRFDITVVTGFELGFLTGGQVKPLFDDLGIADAAKSANSPVRELTSDELVDDVNEFIRILGLSVVVKKRNDLVVAQSGTNLMRDILIRTMIYENGPQPRRDVLALKSVLHLLNTPNSKIFQRRKRIGPRLRKERRRSLLLFFRVPVDSLRHSRRHGRTSLSGKLGCICSTRSGLSSKIRFSEAPGFNLETSMNLQNRYRLPE
ncbi:MAG: nucleotidyltransferase domain-containing protein [Gammaproteobacteria bacterium]|nr:nucleotidyltransferase domain-containing protein [Gammaproteobacteria bacterium]